MRDSIDLIALSLQNLAGRLKEMAAIHRRTPVMGRTHGVHAEPITFGVKFLVWLAEAERNAARLKAARENAAVGCISGAVGTYAFVPPQVEEYVCRELGLKPAKASTQVLQRDRHAEVLFALTVTSSLCEKICLEMRHLQRTEVLEAEEGFGRGQKGSSAMPHKRNPINFEQVCGLCRILRGNLSAALENIPLWHERDISHSSVERVILPDSFILCHHIINKTEKLLGELTVHQDRMKKNIDLTRGLHYSQRLLLHLCSRGVPREKAYSLVQQAAARVWENPAATFREEVAESREIMDLLGEGGLEEIFDPGYFFRYIDDIYARFGMAGE
jgi:adenylosuccinate lyase